MPPPKAEGVREQVLALVKEGHSVRAIETILAGRGVKIGKTAIADIAKQFHAGTLKPKRSKPAAAPPPRAPVTAPEAGAEEAPAPLDPAAVADLDIEDLCALAKLLRIRLRKAVKAGAVKLVPVLLTSKLIVSREIAKLRPPASPDPAKDPANQEAREALRARLEQLVASAHQSGAGLEQLRAHLARAEEEAARRPAVGAPPPEAVTEMEGWTG